MPTCYLGLGSNLDKPQQQLASALDAIDASAHCRLLRCSSFYQSKAVGPEQPDYTNAVAEISTTLDPLALLDCLQGIENEHGRVRTLHWGPRTLDIDILLYADRCVEHERLNIPHKEMHWRDFVLVPLSELQPELCLPSGQSLAVLLQDCVSTGLVRID